MTEQERASKMEVTHHLSHTIFVKSESLSLASTQQERIIQRWENQEAGILEDYPQSMPTTSDMQIYSCC